MDNFTTIRASAVSTVTALIRGPRRYSCDTVVSVITQSMQSTVALDRILISWRDFYEWLEFKFYKAAFLGKTRNSLGNLTESLLPEQYLFRLELQCKGLVS